MIGDTKNDKNKKNMKSTLIIRKFNTTPTIGTMCTKEIKSFFGSKLVDIEDEIYVNDISIQYSEVVDKTNVSKDHYQYLNNSVLQPETVILKSLDNVKFENHSIDVYSQSDRPNNNFEWILNINVKNILREYLFLRLKESRVFKCIKTTNVIDNNINNYIYGYIDTNILNRYNMSYINFYVQYLDVLNKTTLYTHNQVLKRPNFNKNVFNEANRIQNVNIITPDYLSNLDTVKIIYNQIQLLVAWWTANAKT
jgi:hypothetical protein